MFIYADLKCFVEGSKSKRLFLPLVRDRGELDSRGRHQDQFDSKLHVGDVTRFWFHLPPGLQPILISHWYAQPEDASSTRWIKDCQTISILKSISLPSAFIVVGEVHLIIRSSQTVVEEVYPPHFCKTATWLDLGNVSESQLWNSSAMKDRARARNTDETVAYVKIAHRRNGIITRIVIVVRRFEPTSIGEEHIIKLDLVKWRLSRCASLADFELSDLLQRREISGLEALKNKRNGVYIGDFVVEWGPGGFITVSHRADEVDSGRTSYVGSESSSEDEPRIRTLEMSMEEEESSEEFFS
jgi:hypothetical protein